MFNIYSIQLFRIKDLNNILKNLDYNKNINIYRHNRLSISNFFVQKINSQFHFFIS